MNSVEHADQRRRLFVVANMCALQCVTSRDSKVGKYQIFGGIFSHIWSGHTHHWRIDWHTGRRLYSHSRFRRTFDGGDRYCPCYSSGRTSLAHGRVAAFAANSTMYSCASRCACDASPPMSYNRRPCRMHSLCSPNNPSRPNLVSVYPVDPFKCGKNGAKRRGKMLKFR